MAKKKVETKPKSKVEKVEPTPQEQSFAERMKLAKSITDNINKKAGEVVVGFASDSEIKERLKITYVPFPSHVLNEATGGGIPIGKTTQICGDKDSGKTSLILETIGNKMKTDPFFIVIWVESESSLSDEQLEMFGIDMDRFIIVELDERGAGEAAMEQCRAYLKSGVPHMIVINSIKALTVSEEFEKSISQQTIGKQARFVSKLMGIFTPMISRQKTSFVLVNHLSTNIGQMHGDPLVAACGRSLGYYSMMILDLRKKTVLDTDPIVGEKEQFMKIGAAVRKNHCTVTRNPYVRCDYFIEYGKGTDTTGEVLSVAINAGILTKTGAWIREYDAEGEVRKLDDGFECRWNGQKKLKEYVDLNPEYLEYLEARISGYEVQDMTEEEVKAIQDQENRDREFHETYGEKLEKEELANALGDE